MNIKGLIKTSLVDYPGHLAATVFTGGCNMLCPFCHNGDLVLSPNEGEQISVDDFFHFIDQRKGVLDGICISGGEPTLQKDLLEFLARIKAYGLKVKLDTNGLLPKVIESALKLDVVDYIAMDIKNSPKKYPLTAGISKELFRNIEETADLIIGSKIDYEFRTTVVKELHDFEDFIQIGEWLTGSKKYCLQCYQPSGNQISKKSYSSHPVNFLKNVRENLLLFLKEVEIRGY